MKDDYSYAIEKLNQSLRTLVTGAGDVRSRLWTAYVGFHPLKETDFPDNLRKDWKWIIDKLTKHPPVYDYKGNVTQGSVEVSLKKMKNKTGVKIADKILYIYDQLKHENYVL